MAQDMNQLRNALMEVRPIQEKMRMGETHLSSDEAMKLSRTLETCQRYLDSM
jgi:hypothetical protein